MICQKCGISNGKCENGVCKCQDGYFGRICNRVSKAMDSDSTSITRSLRQFESITLEDTYDKGDKTTYFTIQSVGSPSILFIMNQATQPSYNLLFREDRGDQSMTSMIERWDNNKRTVQLVVENSWAAGSVINLSPAIIEITFTITSRLV
jgi:hypothetical protein